MKKIAVTGGKGGTGKGVEETVKKFKIEITEVSVSELETI